MTRCSLILPEVFFCSLLLSFAYISLTLLTVGSTGATKANNTDRNKYTKENSRLIRPFVCARILLRMSLAFTIHFNSNFFSPLLLNWAPYIICRTKLQLPTVKQISLFGHNFYFLCRMGIVWFFQNAYLYTIPLDNVDRETELLRIKRALLINLILSSAFISMLTVFF